jgi:hypothetical protein
MEEEFQLHANWGTLFEKRNPVSSVGILFHETDL